MLKLCVSLPAAEQRQGMNPTGKMTITCVNQPFAATGGDCRIPLIPFAPFAMNCVKNQAAMAFSYQMVLFYFRRQRPRRSPQAAKGTPNRKEIVLLRLMRAISRTFSSSALVAFRTKVKIYK